MILYAGEIIEVGSVYGVLKNYKHPYTKALMESTPALGMRGRRIEAIKGKPPDLAFLPVGCKFAPRCHEAMEECVRADIDFFEVGTEGDSHLVRCILYK
jgi:oligopeptide/dipeptide ABC transporter ATP-binding protein